MACEVKLSNSTIATTKFNHHFNTSMFSLKTKIIKRLLNNLMNQRKQVIIYNQAQITSYKVA